MKKVDLFSVQFKYTGSFESYIKEELIEMGKAHIFRVDDPYVCTIELDDETAAKVDGIYEIVDLYPCNKIACMNWYELTEEEEE